MFQPFPPQHLDFDTPCWYIFSVEHKLNNDSLKHHCGIAGVYSKEIINIPEKLFYLLFSLQHRGQESAGIAYKKDDEIIVYKDLGMVSAVLSRYLKKDRPSKIGIGHVRYSTHGGNKIENIQPLQACCNKGNISIAHNGNISNAVKLKEELVEEGSIFQSKSDTELILHMISRSRKKTFNEALKETLLKLEGAFSMVMVYEDKLLAMRDPQGFRPLYIGFDDTKTVIASETCALDMLQINNRREVKPGEIITIDKNGLKSEIYATSKKLNKCVFELIYFARPDSLVFDECVHTMRKRMGAALAECDNNKGDIVIAVPDSGNSAALGYAEASGTPFEQGLTRNHYTGRSFILPTTAERELAVRIKLHPIKNVIKNKKIILIDDSLVRGTTSKILVKLIREAGAKEIHLRLSSPEIKWPCYYGIDIPTRQELISNSKSSEEIAKYIEADSVMFLPIEKLKECAGDASEYCFACFNGQYPDFSK